MMDELCCFGEMQASVDTVVDDTDYGSKGIVIQLNGMSELMCQDFEMLHMAQGVLNNDAYTGELLMSLDS